MKNKDYGMKQLVTTAIMIVLSACGESLIQTYKKLCFYENATNLDNDKK